MGRNGRTGIEANPRRCRPSAVRLVRPEKGLAVDEFFLDASDADPLGGATSNADDLEVGAAADDAVPGLGYPPEVFDDQPADGGHFGRRDLDAEGMGGRADLTTVPPVRAPQLAGTRQALDRTQRVAVNLERRISGLPRPDLLGALVKASASASDHVRGPQRHLEDLARLYRLVSDPAEPTWEVLDDPSERAAARAARRLLTTPPT